ncbi:tRNA pseudouridine(55) synthase TruB [Candidatus Amarobacter glycogenicus]|uniref:tRNA pseudouridine(55) synthase TruB n=1 Tax=Candidatus Amarobacter glycogenicus TaxID=3140699 RepID=UPI00313561EE|nr:tRNA pseudouridine(55) synthase TruB [Dehalococcoidia bacterium]
MSKRSDSGLDGILLIDKPAGWTSHDVVAKARRITGQRRIGHTGTLDPMATGLLVLCLGQATRLVEYLTGHDKRYTGTIALGRTTTTDDAEGETVEESAVPRMDEGILDDHLEAFRGPILQKPPVFSALKIAGRRAYDLARSGEAPELAARRVTVHGLDAAIAGPGTVAIDVSCSSGTYIRSLARDLGPSLGCGGHLSALRRHRAGPFSLQGAVTLERLEAAAADGTLDELLLPTDDGISVIDAAILGAEGVDAVAHGVAWQAPGGTIRAADPVRIYGTLGEFVGIGSVSDTGEIRPRKVFLSANSRKSSPYVVSRLT